MLLNAAWTLYLTYTSLNEGLRRILATFRYQRVKRLIIIRGFLFWLQVGESVSLPCSLCSITNTDGSIIIKINMVAMILLRCNFLYIHAVYSLVVGEFYES